MPSICATLKLMALLTPALTSAAPVGLGYRQEPAPSATDAAPAPTEAPPAPPAEPPAAPPAPEGGLSDIDILQL